MIDPLIIFFLLMQLIVIVTLFILLALQIYKFKSQNKILENYFFPITMVFGILAFTPLLVSYLHFAVYEDEAVSIFLQTFVFTFLSYMFYFWYRHYQSISEILPPKGRHFGILILALSNTFFVVLHLLGFYLPFAQLLTEILPHPIVVAFFYLNPLPPDELGNIITVLSNTTMLQGIIVFGYIFFIIHNSRLIELHKSSKFELTSVFVFWISLTLFFINNLFLTFGLYPAIWRDSGFDILILIIIFSFFFIAILILLIHYIIVFPPHLLSPSLQLEYFKKLTLALTSEDLKTIELPDSPVSLPVKPHLHLSSTAIEILIYFFRNQTTETSLEDIQLQLGLKPVAVSHYLRVLHNHKYIEHKEFEPHNTHSKAIIISSQGNKFLLSLYKNIYSHFGSLLTVWGDFYQEQNYSDEEISSYLSKIQNIVEQSE